jgi:hypothetical protein
MAEQNNIIELSREEFERGELSFPANHVVVEIIANNDNVTTPSGVIVGIETRLVYAEGSNSLAADMEECWGIVVKTPEGLYYSEDDPKSMNWKTDMLLQVDDLMWGGIMEFHSGLTLHVDGKIYKIIPYSDLYVAKRGDKVIPLNGYVLLQTVHYKKISDLDVISEDLIDPSRGIVAFVGEPNKGYKHPIYVDHTGLKVGDEVLLAPRTPILFLERKVTFARFNGDNLYFVVPMYKIVAVLRRDDNA